MPASVMIENSLSVATHAAGGHRVFQVQEFLARLAYLNQRHMCMSSRSDPFPARLETLLQGAAFPQRLSEEQEN